MLVMKCFLIDDDEDDRDFFISALSRINPKFICETALHGEDALRVLKEQPEFVPDCIFLDLNMPFMDGMTCLKELKKLPEIIDVPVIILSTSSYEKDIEDTRKLGASNYMIKPTCFNELIKKLISYFEGSNSNYLLKI